MEAYDVVILGGGPGGYVAALRAVQLGLRTALVEREQVGGVCLNVGCIPTKALIHNANVVHLFKHAKDYGVKVEGLSYDYAPAVERSRKVSDRLVKGVSFLLKRGKIDVFKGTGVITKPGMVQVRPDGTELPAKNIIVATGSRPRPLPGLEFDGQTVVHSWQAVLQREMPASMLVIGGGPIGVEFGYVYNAYDCKVTIVEMMPRIIPLEEPDVTDVVQKQLTKQGIQIRTDTRVQSIERVEGGVRARLAGPKGEEEITAERVLVAIGIQGNSEEIGLEALGVETSRGFIQIDDHMATNVPGVYAIGDVTGKLALAHVASAQGEIAVETIAGEETHPLVYHNMPRAVYCHPQVASLGLTEAEARERGHDVRTGSFPFRPNGKALAQNDLEGFVKIIIDARYGELLGASMVGPEVTELLPELALTQSLEATAEDIGRTVHAHPTLSEAVREAALGALGRAIHF